MSNNNLHKKLRRFDNLITTEKKKRPATDIPEHYTSLAQALGGELITNHAGAYCLVREFYPDSYHHGRLILPTEQLERSLGRSAFAMKELPGSVKVSSLLFIDTETTGLGGTGAVAFLVGCGSVTENGFEVRQYLMPDYSDETAMLEALLEELSPDKTLVTYNGAAFDLPLLRSRMIVNRVARELPMADHLDLLHAARRLFRRRLGDCSLANVERELFEFHRQDDVPGYLIPSLYFDWLGSRKLEGLIGVLEHNRLDIVSLWFLAVMVAEAFESDGSTLDAADDLHSLARVYSRRKHHDKVVDLCRRREEIALGAAESDVTLFQAQAFKRAGEKRQAVSLWRSLSGGDDREAYWANLELAKYYEHAARDYPEALCFAQTAQRICPYSKSQKDQIKHRIKRLMTRIKA